MEDLTKYATFYEKTIIDNINFDSYGFDNDAYLYDKIKTLYNIFKLEHIHAKNKHLSEVILLSEWLRGLPSVLTVPYDNFEILENAKNAGVKISSADDFLESYWNNLAEAFFTLKNNL
jgi:hypothetical protein